MLDANKIGWSRKEMAQKVAIDIPDGSYVNLGIGIPELVADFVPKNREVIYQTENGLLGMGKAPSKENEDRELVNAGKKCITAIPGASFFHHADSFAMIRGGHIDICILGAMQVSKEGDLANWSTGSKDAIPAVGGAMDLAVGAKRVFLALEHTTKEGEPRLLKSCSLPLTAPRVVSKVITNLGFFEVTSEGFVMKEIAPGYTPEEVQEQTEAKLIIDPNLKEVAV